MGLYCHRKILSLIIINVAKRCQPKWFQPSPLCADAVSATTCHASRRHQGISGSYLLLPHIMPVSKLVLLLKQSKPMPYIKTKN